MGDLARYIKKKKLFQRMSDIKIPREKDFNLLLFAFIRIFHIIVTLKIISNKNILPIVKNIFIFFM
jgi:hypothetical protein